MRLRLPLAALLAAATLLAAPTTADSGQGFVARRTLHRTVEGIEDGEDEVIGGVEAYVQTLV